MHCDSPDETADAQKVQNQYISYEFKGIYLLVAASLLLSGGS